MSPAGEAKRLAPSRLAGFEDDGDDLAGLLGPRTPRPQPPTTTTDPANGNGNAPAAPTTDPTPDAPSKQATKQLGRGSGGRGRAATGSADRGSADQEAADKGTPPAPEATDSSQSTRRTQPKSTSPARASQASHGGRRPTVVQIPARLRDPFLALRTEQGLTNAQLIIAALEDFDPAAQQRPTVGGGRFQERSIAHRTDGDDTVWPVNVVFYASDIEAMAAMTTEGKFPSRTALISAALTLYLTNHPLR